MGEESFWARRQFSLLTLIMQVVFIVLFAIFADYSSNAKPNSSRSTKKQNGSSDNSHEIAPAALDHYYPMFQDVHVMIFIGFGYLMTFLKRYGYCSVGINFLLASFVLQWGMLVRGFFTLHDGKFTIGIHQLLTADFSAAAVLISMGAMLGKLSPIQYLIMGLIETVIGTVCEHIVFHELQVNDVGGSMVVHIFGAYFGLVVGRVLYRSSQVDHRNETFVYHSDMFAFIGTLFLWIYWPSFNSAVAEPADARHRAVVNTYLALAACAVTAFAISSLVHEETMFDMDQVLNGSIAGGVAIGTTANMVLHPFGAMIVGAGTAVVSVIGYKWIEPFLTHRLKFHDTCGVHNLHGMPGVIAGIVGVIATIFVSEDLYGDSLKTIFPAMVSGGGHGGGEGHARSAGIQALFQLAAIGICFAFAVVGGLITGFVLKLPIWTRVDDDQLYSDEAYWEMPLDFDVVTRKNTQADLELYRVQSTQPPPHTVAYKRN